VSILRDSTTRSYVGSLTDVSHFFFAYVLEVHSRKNEERNQIFTSLALFLKTVWKIVALMTVHG